ncbi:hypothetical protein ACQP3J_29215, partial [Escherichia coli]
SEMQQGLEGEIGEGNLGGTSTITSKTLWVYGCQGLGNTSTKTEFLISFEFKERHWEWLSKDEFME